MQIKIHVCTVWVRVKSSLGLTGCLPRKQGVGLPHMPKMPPAGFLKKVIRLKLIFYLYICRTAHVHDTHAHARNPIINN